MLAQYFFNVFAFAGRGIVLRTDAIQILISALLPALFRATGLPMPETTASAIAAYLGYGLAAFFLLRVLGAPYFIWREALTENQDLKQKLNEPSFLERQGMVEANVRDKLELSNSLGQIKYWVQGTIMASRGNDGRPIEALNEARSAVGQLAEQLGYDSLLRDRCFDIINLGDRIVAGHREGSDVRAERAELSNLIVGVQKYLRTGEPSEVFQPSQPSV